MRKTDFFAEKLLEWYEENKRNFIWRQVKNPYKILIAEKMLQKTVARNVATIYPKFLERYPNSLSLSRARIKSIENIIKPLGLHKRRAKEFKQLAISLVENFGGKVPDEREKLGSLYGVGDYVANSVLCFAFNKRVPIIDTNVSRIVDRVFGVAIPKDPRRDKNSWKKIEMIIPKNNFKEFNWALLDFAAKVCTAKVPECNTCPINSICSYYTKS
jgi:A/G-specific adenine glycosylase